MKILYFADIREKLDCPSESIEPCDTLKQVSDLLALLHARGPLYQAVLNRSRILIAVNQEMAQLDSPIAAGDEIAFFPPVTGG